LRCSSEHSESGVVVVTPRDNHGNGASFSPSELLSVSLGSCILSIMGIIARSMDIDITGATAKGGALMLIVGVCEIVWSNIRQRG
jgi:uncharacterized OsmC-like protein